jgi:hypothetical protein
MNITRESLSKIELQVRRHTWLDRDEKYVANVLIIAGSYFLNKGIPAFHAFPYLARAFSHFW